MKNAGLDIAKQSHFETIVVFTILGMLAGCTVGGQMLLHAESKWSRPPGYSCRFA